MRMRRTDDVACVLLASRRWRVVGTVSGALPRGLVQVLLRGAVVVQVLLRGLSSRGVFVVDETPPRLGAS
eukprot:858122-Alexandrium_andersonii.AAC.1